MNQSYKLPPNLQKQTKNYVRLIKNNLSTFQDANANAKSERK